VNPANPEAMIFLVMTKRHLSTYAPSPKCGDAEARAFLAKLKRIVGDDVKGPGKMK
jgi:hypothetical protein